MAIKTYYQEDSSFCLCNCSRIAEVLGAVFVFLSPDFMNFTFLVQPLLVFTVFLLNIFDRGLVFGKFFLNILKNDFPMLVSTFREKEGLSHITFLFLFIFGSLLWIFWWLNLAYEKISVKPLLFNAFSYVSVALLNTFLSQGMSEIRLSIDFRSSFKILGGWFYCLWK